jgi:hypothetical protein
VRFGIVCHGTHLAFMEGSEGVWRLDSSYDDEL